MMQTPSPHLQSMPTTRTQLAAAMIAVVAEDPEHRATSSLFYARGQAVCIQGALLAKLGYPFKTGNVYGGSYRDVVQVMGFRHQSLEENALAVAQFGSDSGLPWGWLGEVFAQMLDGKMSYADGVKAVQDKTRQVRDWGSFTSSADKLQASMSAAMQGIAKMQIWVDEAAKAMAHTDNVQVSFDDTCVYADHAYPSPAYAKKVLTW